MATTTTLSAITTKLKDAQAFLDKLPGGEMGSPTVDSVARDAELEPNVSLGPFQKLSLNLRGALSAQILNGPEDEDQDGVAGIATDDGAALTPPLELTKTGTTWLKYRLEAGIKASGSGSASALAFEFEGEAQAVLLDYRAHARAEKVLQAALADLTEGPRVAFSLAHLLAQGKGDSLAVRLLGKLKASATLSWSDVFTSQLGSVLSATGVKTAVGLKISAGASVTGSIALVDDFVVIFTRLSPSTWRVGVRKARERRLGLSASAGVTATFDQPKQIEAILGSYLTGLVGGPVAEVKKLLAKGDIESLPAAQRALVQRLLEQFGVPDVPERLARLKEKIEAAEKAAKGAIERAAKAKLEVGFAYEYSRLDVRTLLLEADLDESALKAHHGDLVWGRLDGALAEDGGGVTVQRYLDEKSSTRAKSWGFSLGLDKWKLAGKDTRSLQKVERRDVERRIQRSYRGLRGYKGKWISRNWSWEVDFSAAMGGFSAEVENPRVSEFGCGLGVLWHQDAKKLTSDDVDELLDTASLWRIVDVAGAASARRLLKGLEDKPYEATLHLLLDTSTFWDLRELLANPEAGSMAGALAAAMPWWPKIRPFTPDQRRATFTRLWAEHLANPQTPPQSLGLVQQLGPARAAIETKLGTHTFVGLAEMNSGTPAAFQTFTRGMRSLDQAVKNGEFDKSRLPAVFDDLQAFFGQSHHIRALGAYLLDAAARRDVLGGVQRSLSITPVGGSNADTVVIAPPA